mmetsp:Transcript_24995/g.80541  ORF Transcript_24995/g.80541 Transcript_24995/m.80541 type:complete len:463 (+) Transcript_24995:26-1414(+)
MKVVSLFLALAATQALVEGSSRVGGLRTLVVVKDDGVRQSHSMFLKDLEARGHSTTVVRADDSGVVLQKYGEYLFDHLVLLAPDAEDIGGLDVQHIVNFVDDGGNLMMALDETASDFMRDLASECGVEVDEPGTVVMDHVDHNSGSDDHTLVFTSNVAKVPLIVGSLKSSSAPVLFKGVGLAVGEENILAVRVLSAGAAAYSADPNEPIRDYPQAAGTDVLLVAAVQARNNARVLVSGSLDLLSNALFEAAVQAPGADSPVAPRSSNRQLAQELSKWTFCERGVLRARDVSHQRADGRDPERQLEHEQREDLPTSLYPEPEIARDTLVYRIKDDVEYAVTIEEWDGKEWQPYAADDVQMEFVMLNPYVRATLKHDDSGRFSTVFKVPDVYGIYQFRIMYRRPGYSTLFLSDQVSVRPFRHNEYERFIPAAFPYYASTLAMMGSFFVFGFVFLYHKDVKPKSD